MSSGLKNSQYPLHQAVLDNNLLEFQDLLEQEGVDINAKNDDGLTPLSIAAMMNNEKIMRLLLGMNKIQVDANT